MEFKTVALSKKIQDNPEILAFVNESLATCSSLKPEEAKTNEKLKHNPKSKGNHVGHDH